MVAVNENKIQRRAVACGIKSRGLDARQTLPLHCSTTNASYVPLRDNALYAETKSAFRVRINTQQNAVCGHRMAQYLGGYAVPNADLDHPLFSSGIVRQRCALGLTCLCLSFGQFQCPKQEMSRYSHSSSATTDE